MYPAKTTHYEYINCHNKLFKFFKYNVTNGQTWNNILNYQQAHHISRFFIDNITSYHAINTLLQTSVKSVSRYHGNRNPRLIDNLKKIILSN